MPSKRQAKLKIEYLPISEIKPYGNNAKIHTAEQIEQIAKSIREFGFNDPIAISNGVIVEGHGRLLAGQKLGIEELPVIRLDGLTEAQRRAYTLIHNQLTLNSDFDLDTLNSELEDLQSLDDFELDFADFGFDFDGYFENELNLTKDENDGYYGDAREVTNKKYNLAIDSKLLHTHDFWQMPIIKKDNFIPSGLLGFNYAKSSNRFDVGLHFFLDDYQFERLWNEPEKYINILKQYECVLSPDFSLYLDMPMPMKIWNIYRSRLLGAYWQSLGMTVIPTISWAEPETFEFCFNGVEKGCVVAISTIGVKENKDAMKIWKQGTDEMIKKIQPSAILVYGGKIEHFYDNIPVCYFENSVLERWKNSGKY